MRDPHSRDTGSTPVRAADYGQVVKLGYTRRSERRARKGVRVRLSPWLLATEARRACEESRAKAVVAKDDADAAGAQLAFIRPVSPARYRDLQLRVGQRPAEPHKFRPPGATPGPATAEYANRQSGHVESVAILWVRLPLRSL